MSIIVFLGAVSTLVLIFPLVWFIVPSMSEGSIWSVIFVNSVVRFHPFFVLISLTLDVRLSGFVWCLFSIVSLSSWWCVLCP